jgi:putative ABC transport system permease protein
MNLSGPFDVGLVTGLLMAFSVYGLSTALRLFNFPDLTVEGSFLLGAVGFAVGQKSGLGMSAAVLLGVSLGFLSGLLTGGLHSIFGINKFLAGIIVVSVAYTVGLRLMGASNIGLLGTPTIFDRLDEVWRVDGISLGKISFLAALYCTIGILLVTALNSHTGLKLRVAGSNPAYAKTLGISVSPCLMAGLAATNSLSALSGALLAAHQGFADIGLGQGVLIFALASMTLGEGLISDRLLPVPAFILLAAIVGSIAYQVVVAFAVRVGLNPVDLKLVTAVLVLALIVVRSSRMDAAFAD